MNMPSLPKKGVVISIIFNLALLAIVGFTGYKIANANDVVLVRKENAQVVNFCISHPEICRDAQNNYFENVKLLNSSKEVGK